jgi:hypothetical protein
MAYNMWRTVRGEASVSAVATPRAIAA